MTKAWEVPETKILSTARHELWRLDHAERSGQPIAADPTRLRVALAALLQEHENLCWQHERLRIASLEVAQAVVRAVDGSAAVSAVVTAYAGPDSNVPADWAARRLAAERRMLEYLEAQPADAGNAPTLPPPDCGHGPEYHQRGCMGCAAHYHATYP